MKINEEWFIDAPWGKIALVSWGTPKGRPVLLVHGRQDSLATFIPLLDLLQDQFHYVGFDLPGHGKSEPFPVSVMLSRTHFVAPVDIVVKSLGWKTFMYIGHSMGAEIGLFYNAIRPGKVSKLILLDAGVAFQKMAPTTFTTLYSNYEEYYQNYAAINFSKKVHTKASAIESIQHARAGLSSDLAELILSRNLIPHEETIKEMDSDQSLQVVPLTNEYSDHEEIVEEKYTLSWDQRLKNLAYTNLSFDHCVFICTAKTPPILFIAASESVTKYKNKFAEQLINEMCLMPNFTYLEVQGNHDLHLIYPERLVEDIMRFLDLGTLSAKL